MKLDEFPEFSWEAEPGALYTLLIEDEEPEPFPGSIVVHYLATNIPGIISYNL